MYRLLFFILFIFLFGCAGRGIENKVTEMQYVPYFQENAAHFLEILESEDNPSLKYYIQNPPTAAPTSFIELSDTSFYTLVITKQDLLAQAIIVPADPESGFSARRLKSVEIISVINGKEELLREFDEDDIAKILVSMDKDDTLTYESILTEGKSVVIRYWYDVHIVHHTAVFPRP